MLNKKNPVSRSLALGMGLALAMMASLTACATTPQAMADKNASFRAENQGAHDAIDAQYTHKYLEAGGVRWHYVDNLDQPKQVADAINRFLAAN